MAPLGGVVPREAPLRLAVTLPAGELLLCPKPAGSVCKPRGVPLEPVLPEKGEPLAVALPLKGVCIPVEYRKCRSQCQYTCQSEYSCWTLPNSFSNDEVRIRCTSNTERRRLKTPAGSSLAQSAFSEMLENVDQRTWGAVELHTTYISRRSV